jgi:phosphatidate cytidylyltransferase
VSGTPTRGRRSSPSQRRAHRAARRNTHSDLGARIFAAIPAIAFALFIVIQGGIVFAIGLIALGLVCLHELFAMYDDVGPAKLAGFAGLVGVVLAAHFGDPSHVLLALVAFFPLLFLVTVAQPRGGTLGMAVAVLGVAWVGLAIAHAVLLRDLEHGAAVIVIVLVGTFIGDSGAYSGGRMFGRTPLAPRISPNKTVEGLGIGIATAILATWLAGTWTDDVSGVQALILGAAVAIAAPLGDLFESYVKRDAGTKDTGRLFGAHGGALDRLDAVFFTAVVGYYVWSAML